MMGKVIMSGIVPPLVAPVTYADNFADNTWEQIIDACQKNAVPDTWLVGDQKAMTINGTDYLIDIIGKNHDDYADGSGKAPLTFQMHDLYETQYRINVTQTLSWEVSEMRNTYLPLIMESMPSNVQSGIRAVNKKSSAGNLSSTIITTADKMFLLAEYEVHGSIEYSYSGEGKQYAYYVAGNSKIKTRIGSADNWWLRSPSNDYGHFYCLVGASGGKGRDASQVNHGVSFAFCF